MKLLLALAAATAALLCGTAVHVARARAGSAGCEMTYMYASYHPVAVAGETPSDRRYRLFLYREDNGASKQGARRHAWGGVRRHAARRARFQRAARAGARALMQRAARRHGVLWRAALLARRPAACALGHAAAADPSPCALTPRTPRPAAQPASPRATPCSSSRATPAHTSRWAARPRQRPPLNSRAAGAPCNPPRPEPLGLPWLATPT
jgi:hypothetical protein